MALTQTESWYLGEAIKGETLMCQKLANYLSHVQDPEPVSYTHLDVYKRQRQYSTLPMSIICILSLRTMEPMPFPEPSLNIIGMLLCTRATDTPHWF